MTVIRDQKRKVKHMDTQQEIEQHEKELKSLLSRVLKEPLSDKLSEFGIRLDALEGTVADLRDAQLGASTNIKDCIGELATKQRMLSADASEALTNRFGVMRTQLTQDVSDTVGKKVEDLHEAQLGASTNIKECIDKTDELFRQQENLAEKASAELAERLENMRTQLTQGVSDTVVGKIVDSLGTRLAELEKRLQDGHSALEKAREAWQSDQVTRHSELEANVSTQLTAVGKSVRAAQFMTLIFAVIGAVGVVVTLVRSVL